MGIHLTPTTGLTIRGMAPPPGKVEKGHCWEQTTYSRGPCSPFSVDTGSVAKAHAGG